MYTEIYSPAEHVWLRGSPAMWASVHSGMLILEIVPEGSSCAVTRAHTFVQPCKQNVTNSVWGVIVVSSVWSTVHNAVVSLETGVSSKTSIIDIHPT